jgi:hypothetical protein
MKNKKGWIRIVEAIFAVLLIAIILLTLILQRYSNQEDFSEEIYAIENSILREIQLNNSARAEIINMDPINHEIPGNVTNIIENYAPNYLGCEAAICNITDDYILDKDIEFNKEIYVQSIMIMSNLNVHNPKQVKLFCWIE